MKKRLKRDIVIPAGTQFRQVPHGSTTTRYGDDHYDHVIGLTADSCGTLTYLIDPRDPGLAEWFEDMAE